MSAPTETIDESAPSRVRDGARPVPGLVLVFSAGEPLQGVIPVTSEPLVIGRGGLRGVELSDGCMSRQHASVRYAKRQWFVRDMGSRNGTSVDGVRVSGEVEGSGYSVLRTGETLFLLCRNVRPFLEHHVEFHQDVVLGPRMRPAFQQIQRAANAGALHVTGETGAGKEIAARAFHELGPSKRGPFVAVNCAAIPEGIAERLLFGAKKGAYSGAQQDANGYVQEADGGTLFLDEVGELDLQVQAKLLRVLETGEVLALGASRPRKVDVRICSATHRDLREAVASGKFREDLFYRLGRPRVSLLPLRERVEDIPFLIDRRMREVDTDAVAHVSFVEACLLRPWPGNVRELMAEVRDAASEALAQGKSVVKVSHLPEEAGQAYRTDGSHSAEQVASSPKTSPFPPREEIESALRRCEGRVATAARELRLHRNQLRRWLEKNQLDPSAFAQQTAETE